MSQCWNVHESKHLGAATLADETNSVKCYPKKNLKTQQKSPEKWTHLFLFLWRSRQTPLARHLCVFCTCLWKSTLQEQISTTSTLLYDTNELFSGIGIVTCASLGPSPHKLLSKWYKTAFVCSLVPAGPNCAAVFHLTFICCSSREEMMCPSVCFRCRRGKIETQLHLRLTSRNESSASTHPLSASSQVHEVRGANLCLFCHQRGIHLVSMHDDFRSSPTTVLWWKWRTQCDFLLALTKSITTHRRARLAKVNVLFELLLWGMFGLCQLISPKRSDLPVWIRSPTAQSCNWTHRKPSSQDTEPGSSPILPVWNPSDWTPPSRESLMWDKDLLLTVVRRRHFCGHYPLPPPEWPGCRPGSVVAAQFGVMQQVPHEPNLRDTEAVNDHEFSVETGVEGLEVRGSWRARDPECPEPLVA